MKHITTLIALALVLGSLAPLAAQNKMTAKEKVCILKNITDNEHKPDKSVKSLNRK